MCICTHPWTLGNLEALWTKGTLNFGVLCGIIGKEKQCVCIDTIDDSQECIYITNLSYYVLWLHLVLDW